MKFSAMAIDGSAFLLLALLLLTAPLPWVGAALAAAAFHEACHWAALRLTGVRLRGMTVSAAGAVLKTGPMEPRQELWSALAGPAGSLLLLTLLRRFPRIALCGGIQGIFNLLPVYPLDGGRALRCLLKFRYSEQSAGHIAGIAENLTLAAIAGAGAALSFGENMGIAPVLAAVTMVMKAKMRKTPCKELFQRVQ